MIPPRPPKSKALQKYEEISFPRGRIAEHHNWTPFVYSKENTYFHRLYIPNSWESVPVSHWRIISQAIEPLRNVEIDRIERGVAPNSQPERLSLVRALQRFWNKVRSS